MYWLQRVLVSFFFQAEDGIRDTSVTGVQTCALPIYGCYPRSGANERRVGAGSCAREKERRPGALAGHRSGVWVGTLPRKRRNSLISELRAETGKLTCSHAKPGFRSVESPRSGSLRIPGR